MGNLPENRAENRKIYAIGQKTDKTEVRRVYKEQRLIMVQVS